MAGNTSCTYCGYTQGEHELPEMKVKSYQDITLTHKNMNLAECRKNKGFKKED
jgi:hypothetical protein